MLNKGAIIKIINRLFSKPSKKTPDSLFECVCLIGEKAIYAVIAPSFAHPFDKIDNIPCVKIEDIAEENNE